MSFEPLFDVPLAGDSRPLIAPHRHTFQPKVAEKPDHPDGQHLVTNNVADNSRRGKNNQHSTEDQDRGSTQQRAPAILSACSMRLPHFGTVMRIFARVA